MKRRSFLKGILGTSVISAAPSFAESVSNSISKTKTDIAINLPPRNEEMATKYILGLFNKNNKKFSPKSCGQLTPKIIIGGGLTEKEAWDDFWRDFLAKVNIRRAEDMYIIWRHKVEIDSIAFYDNKRESWKVRCRFSIADIVESV